MLIPLLIAAALAAAVAGAVALTGPVDPVKARSSHERPTPTSGGLGLIAGAAAGVWLAGANGPAAWIVALAAALGLMGAADDLWDVGPLAKAAAHGLIAAALIAAVGPVTTLPLGPEVALPVGFALGVAGSLLFLLVLMNAVNFMDGANGLAPGAGALALAAIAAAAFARGEPALGAAALAGAAAGAGFLPWNLSGRLFQGDAGALFTAALVGGLGLRLASIGAATPYLVVFAVLPLITDVLLTLLARARRRAPLTEAHREHVYQLWLQATGGSHLALSLRVWGLTLLCAGTGVVLDLKAPEWSAAGLAAAVVLLSAGWFAARRRYAPVTLPG